MTVINLSIISRRPWLLPRQYASVNLWAFERPLLLDYTHTHLICLIGDKSTYDFPRTLIIFMTKHKKIDLIHGKGGHKVKLLWLVIYNFRNITWCKYLNYSIKSSSWPTYYYFISLLELVMGPGLYLEPDYDIIKIWQI